MTPSKPPTPPLPDDAELDDAILITPAQLAAYQQLLAENAALRRWVSRGVRYLHSRITATGGTRAERELWQTAQALLQPQRRESVG